MIAYNPVDIGFAARGSNSGERMPCRQRREVSDAPYTASRLAHDAGGSVHIVRDAVLRGLLRPARRTQSGHRLYDDHALERMRFVRTLFEAGVGLDELTRLCHALDGGGGDAIEFLLCLRARLAARRAALDVLDGHLEQMISAIGADTAKESARA